MNGHALASYGINWELLRREALGLLRAQAGWLAAGLAGPLLIALYSLLRDWAPRGAARDLLQAALFLCAWNTLFAVFYALAAWLRPRQEAVEAEQLHLPLSSAHFALRRWLWATVVPLASALLSLPVFGALLLYYGLPYAVEEQGFWNWVLGRELANPWWPRALCFGANVLAAALLPAAAVAWLGELTERRYLRCALLLALLGGMYALIRLLMGWEYGLGGQIPVWWAPWDNGPLVMNYRQTRGVSPLPYLVLGGLGLLLPLLYGWLRPAWRWLLLLLPVLLLGLFLLRRALPEQLRAPLRPASAALFGRDTRYAAGLLIGHLSPPRNVRLLYWSYPSNVLFRGRTTVAAAGPYPDYPPLPPEPRRPDDYASNPVSSAAYEQEYREWEQTTRSAREAYDAQRDAWFAADSAFEAQKADWPRLPLWVMAALYPLLLPLWAVTGLLVGISLRREPQRQL